MPEQAHAQLKELLPTRRYREMSQALSVSRGSCPVPRDHRGLVC
jgi:hypothetical protein